MCPGPGAVLLGDGDTRRPSRLGAEVRARGAGSARCPPAALPFLSSSFLLSLRESRGGLPSFKRAVFLIAPHLP